MFTTYARRALAAGIISSAVLSAAVAPQAALAAPKKSAVEGISIGLSGPKQFGLALRDSGKLMTVSAEIPPLTGSHVRVIGRLEAPRRVVNIKIMSEFPLAGRVTKVVAPTDYESGWARLTGPTGVNAVVVYAEGAVPPTLHSCVRVPVVLDDSRFWADGPARVVKHACVAASKETLADRQSGQASGEASTSCENNENRDKEPNDTSDTQNRDNENRDNENRDRAEGTENRDNENRDRANRSRNDDNENRDRSKNDRNRDRDCGRNDDRNRDRENDRNRDRNNDGVTAEYDVSHARV